MVKAKLISILCLIFLFVGAAQAAAVTARLDRNQVVDGETVTLIIETNDVQQSLEANFSILDRDFELIDQRSETQMSIANGQQTAVVKLLLTLQPRRPGRFTIPPLRFGSATTMPLQLLVENAPEPKPGEAPTVYIEVDVEPKDGPYYVHAQFRLTVRVFYQQSLTEAAISQPEPSPASVRLLDEVPFQADRMGQRYRVLERHYAVFPERSGPLLIPPMKLSGRLVTRRSDRLWQPTVSGRRIEVSSDPIELVIDPKPASFSGDDWLPARSLTMTENISASDSLTVGEPVTRTILVDAVGLEENMITAPPWPELSNTRIYPDQPQGISRNDGKWVLGHKEFRYAVVPEQEGELVLPELTLFWWDTVNNRERSAILPERRLSVLPSSLVPDPPADLASGVFDGQITDGGLQSPSATTGPSYWTWLTFLFLTLWLFTSGLLLWQWRRRPTEPIAKPSEEPDEAALLKSLKQACLNSDEKQVRSSLSAWLRQFGPAGSSGSLIKFASQAGDPDLRTHLLSLDSQGFRPSSEATWNGPELWSAFSNWRKQWLNKTENTKPPVTDLYARA